MDNFTHRYLPTAIDFNLPHLQSIHINEHTHYDIQILCFGKENCKKTKQIAGPEQLGYYSLHYVTDGAGTLNLEGTSYSIQKHTFFLLPPNKTLSYKPNPEHPWNYFWIAFNGVNSSALMERCMHNHTILHNDNPEIASVFEKLIHDNLYPTKKNKDLNALSSFYRILELITESLPEETSQSKNIQQDEGYIIKTLNIINEQYSHPDLCTSSVSAMLNIHPNYFSAIFKKYMKVPFTQYLTAFRMNIAQQLLCFTSRSVREIAEIIGFSDPLYFSRVFKKYYYGAFSPQQYRQHKRKSQKDNN